MTETIHKAAGILLKDRRLLITRSKGKSFFVSPGGKIEAGESAKEALTRELKEELSIKVAEADMEPFGVFEAQAIGSDQWLRMEVFTLRDWPDNLRPDHEVEECRWVTSAEAENVELGSIFAHEVVPRLKAQGLID